MVSRKWDVRLLDQILERLVKTVDNSKGEIFQISEHCRQDYQSIVDELKSIKLMVLQTIDTGDKLETKVRMARKRLSEVSKDFTKYSEAEVRGAYEQAHQLQTELTMNRQEEKQLRERRDELERRLVGLQETIDQADRLASQITVVLKYLTSDLKVFGEVIEDAKRKQDFGIRIIEAQEEERKRISREIHDGPAQMLANVLMRSDLVDRVFRERGAKEALNEIKSLKQMVRSALYEVRKIIYDLRPMALDDLGLIPTLKKYVHTVEDYNKVKINFSFIGEEKRLPSKLEVALFRMIQESIQNAIKHAEASEITVKVEFRCGKVNASIRDNGKGFDINQHKSDSSFGIMGMKERIELLEGNFSIDSKIGEGTHVLIQVPLEIANYV
ncbi:two-component system sensor histidine kinase DegS [Bacillus oleivorans]|uniref:Signal transduction histidine-protein kinase/phosphatase DegS n=1 Tax=Bacillus oleivorans TaxID=1448271 RepID=A0A285CZH1_9BACI|nr:sensor histidine kinase [Bacillus oleivorans]SNX72942.1 two-component system sensor histidine kinase DegS [Bacillus oleivorans]